MSECVERERARERERERERERIISSRGGCERVLDNLIFMRSFDIVWKELR